MKKLITVTLLLVSLIAYSQQKDGYEILKLVKTSPIKNQQFSNACWSFSTTSFIETEIIRKQNKEIILSPMYFVYYNYLYQAENYIRMHGQTRFSPGGLTSHAFKVLKYQGLVPQLEFSGLPPDMVYLNCDIFNSIKRKLDSIVRCEKIEETWKSSITHDLNKYIGKLPTVFEFERVIFNPLEFANSVCDIRAEDYVEITSYSHHPFYENCFLEVPANWNHGEYYNIPINKFMMLIDTALYNGYSLIWDGDISEYPLINENNIDYSLHILSLPSERNSPKRIDQKLRQPTSENYTTTEDHLSHIVGIAKDKSGNKYYIFKDSQGIDKFLNGYLLVSEAYIKLKTISVLTHKDVLHKVCREIE